MSNGKLTLARKLNQPLYLQFIGHDGKHQEINLMISEINGQQSRILTEAPKTVSITRGELIKPSQII